MAKKIIVPTTREIRNTSSQKNRQTTNNKIVLHEVMTLVDKLWEENKQDFLHNLATQKNLSKNVLTLLINQADSITLTRLCSNVWIYWTVLEELIKKLGRINNGIDKVLLIQNAPLYVDFYDDCISDDDEQDNWPVFVQDIRKFMNLLLTNPNLTTLQIENITNSFWDSIDLDVLCRHLNTPSWILEKSYERYPTSKLWKFMLSHRNLPKSLKEKIQSDIQKEQDKQLKDKGINDILERHPDLDIYQMLQYYENDNDTITAQKIAEHIYTNDLWRYRYGSKTHYEKLQFKLELSKRYNLWEGSKLRIIYDMIGDNIVNHGSLEIYEGFGDKPNDRPIYLNIAQTEEKYVVKIDQEQIKIIVKKILDEMLRWWDPDIEKVENVYKIAQDINIEINDIVKKYYIEAIIAAAKKVQRHWEMDRFETLYYFSKSLQLLLANRNLFSVNEIEQYVLAMNKIISFPISNIDHMVHDIQTTYSRTTTLFQNAKKTWFKDIKDLERSDVFTLIDTLKLSKEFKHGIVIKKLRKCLSYSHEKGKALMEKFWIDKSELIDLIIHHWEYQEPSNWIFTVRDTGRCFGMEWQYSLQECLTKYGIGLEEVLPPLLWKIKEDLAANIQKKEYVRAQAIIKNYPISDIPGFQELIKTVQTLTKVQ